MYDLSRFTLSDMTRCGIELRGVAGAAGSMEEAASHIVRTLRQRFTVPGSDTPACVLVRLFVTVPFGELEPELQPVARRLLGDSAIDDESMKCLTLLATAGDADAWNSRHLSVGHRALPLASEESIARSPMISQLIRQLGLEVGTLLHADADVLLDVAQHTFNVFHVPEAPGSPYIPAQAEFVEPYGVKSVLGFGGLLPPGELFATILFSRVPISREAAELFRTLALNVKLALLPFAGARVFA